METIDLKKIKQWRKNSFEELKKLEKVLPEKDIKLLEKCIKEGQKFSNETILQRLIHANQEFKRGETKSGTRSIKNLQANYFLRFAMEKQRELNLAKGHSKYPLEKEFAKLMEQYYFHLPEERVKIQRKEPAKKQRQQLLEAFEIEIKGRAVKKTTKKTKRKRK